MSNKELYQRSFDKLHPSKELERKLQTMMDHQKQKSHKPRGWKMAALAAAVVIVLSLAAACASSLVQTLHQDLHIRIEGQNLDVQQLIENGGHISYSYMTDDTGRIWSFGAMIPDSAYIPDEDPHTIQLEHVCENGRDLLRFTQKSTGLAEDVDITEQMQDGCFTGTVALEKFNTTAQVDLFGDVIFYTIEGPTD